MTLDEAREHVGEPVAYRPAGGEPERGSIATVSTVYVFVQYFGVRGTMATYPEDLTLMAERPAEAPKTPALVRHLTRTGAGPDYPGGNEWTR